MFYGCHPLRAQVVGWASCISYLLSGPFALLAVYAYIEADWRWVLTGQPGGGNRRSGIAACR
jgi:hypothetical protein